MAKSRPFSALPATTQDARVRKALEEGCKEEAGELCMWFEQPEAELPAFTEALERLAESRREYEELCAVPLSERTAKQNARIRSLGNRWENTAAGSGRDRTEEPAEVEPVSVVHESTSKLPSTKEQRERIEELYDSHAIPEEKKRAPENFTKLGAARWINLLESHPLKEEAPPVAKRGRRSVTTNHVQPEEPDYAKMPARSRPKAKRDYQTALAAWKAAEESAADTTIAEAKAGLPVDLETGAKLAEAAKTAPKASTARRGRTTSSGSFDPSDPKVRAEVVRLHTDDKLSMKAIAEKFGLPAVHKSWLVVSMIWREEADARGLSRPRYPERRKETATK